MSEQDKEGRKRKAQELNQRREREGERGRERGRERREKDDIF